MITVAILALTVPVYIAVGVSFWLELDRPGMLGAFSIWALSNSFLCYDTWKSLP